MNRLAGLLLLGTALAAACTESRDSEEVPLPLVVVEQQDADAFVHVHVDPVPRTSDCCSCDHSCGSQEANRPLSRLAHPSKTSWIGYI